MASRKVIALLLSSSFDAPAAPFAVLAGTYGRAQLPPMAEGAGVVVVAEVRADDAAGAAGLGFGGVEAATLAFIHEYFWPRPAAWLATAFDIFFRTSSDMLRAVTPGPSAFFFFFFGAPSSVVSAASTAMALPVVWFANAAACAAAMSLLSFLSLLILVSSSLSTFSIAANCFDTSFLMTILHIAVPSSYCDAGRSN